MKPDFEHKVLQKGLLVLTAVHISIIMSLPVTDAARILGLFATPSPSHNMMFQALMKALAERGHSVEVASPFPLTSPSPANYTDVKLPSPNMNETALLKLLVSPENTPLKEHLGLWKLANILCEIQLASPELQKKLSYNAADPSASQFDLVIVEMFFIDCLNGFAHHFDVPLVAMVSQYSLPWAYDVVGNPKSYSHVPNWFLHYGQKMTFFERLHNALFTIGVGLYRRYVALPQQNEIAMSYFGLSMPPLWEIEKKTSLVLLNGHPVVSPIHPLLPNIVDVAGMHILAHPPPLPKDLQQLMDKHEKVVLFSLGSNIDGNVIKQERLMVILSALKEMPCQVLWRWNGDMDQLPVPIPSNVHASKWLPQQSLLAHPNLVAFVTHGGLLSLQETIYHGVPIVGFPFYGDQFMNLRHASEVGLGINLNFHTFTKEEFVNAVSKILCGTIYSRAAKRLSSIFRDQPETPLERGIYWVEYILRHKGAPHLQSAAVDLMWFQYYLVDVIAFISITLIFVFFAIYCFCTALKTLLFGSLEKFKRD